MIYYLTKQLSTENNFSSITVEEIIDYIRTKKIIGVDTETSGLSFLDKKIIMLQFGDKDNQFVIDARYIDITVFKDVLEDESILKVGQNFKFDIKFFMKLGIDVNNIYDTMLAEYVINCGKDDLRADLNTLSINYTGKTLNKSIRGSIYNTVTAFNNAQITYGAEDVEVLLPIREKQLQLIDKYNLQKVVDLENSVMKGFAEMEFNGINLDSEKWIINAKEAEKNIIVLEKELDEFICNDSRTKHYKIEVFQGNLFEDASVTREASRKTSILWTSPSQVLKVFKLLGINLDSTDAKETLKYLHLPLIKKFSEYREYCKIISTYGNSFLKYIKSDGKIHTTFFQILDTGRVSSGDKKDLSPNLQNIPAKNSYRNCFFADKGESFVAVDYSSQELRIIAAGSKDPVWLDVILKGFDLHSVTAELVYDTKWYAVKEKDCAYYSIINPFGDIAKQKCNCKEHKKLRNSVKTINFGLAYGMSKFKLASTLQISITEAEELINTYFTKFPAIKKFLDLLGNYGTENGFIRTFAPFRRIRWFSKWVPEMSAKFIHDSEIRKEKGSIERRSKNMPIQGSGADEIKQSIIYIMKYRKRLSYKVKLLLQVHDEIVCSVPDEYAKEWAKIQKRLMRLAGKHNINNLPMEAEECISKVWMKG